METSVVDKEGVHGRLLTEARPTAATGQITIAVGERRITLPAAALRRRRWRGGYYVPVRFRDLDTAPEGVTIPVMEEQLRVEKHPRDERVRVKKQVTSRDEWVEVPTIDEEVKIERVAVNREVDTPPEAHYENGTFVIPLIEEVVVTRKRLVLREELRISKRRVEKRRREKVTLHREDVTVNKDRA